MRSQSGRLQGAEESDKEGERERKEVSRLVVGLTRDGGRERDCSLVERESTALTWWRNDDLDSGLSVDDGVGLGLLYLLVDGIEAEDVGSWRRKSSGKG